MTTARMYIGRGDDDAADQEVDAGIARAHGRQELHQGEARHQRREDQR